MYGLTFREHVRLLVSDGRLRRSDHAIRPQTAKEVSETGQIEDDRTQLAVMYDSSNVASVKVVVLLYKKVRWVETSKAPVSCRKSS